MFLLVFAIVCYVLVLVVNLIPLPQPIKNIVLLVLGLILLLVLLAHFGIVAI